MLSAAMVKPNSQNEKRAAAGLNCTDRDRDAIVRL
jgi:hypothetical protein